MANYNLNRSVFYKDSYDKVINTSFSQTPTPAPPLKDTVGVDEFFEIYNNIFYSIPAEGDTNSHSYIIKKSGDYIKADTLNEDIQLLLDEITSLRQELLQANQQILNMQITSSVSSSLII